MRITRRHALFGAAMSITLLAAGCGSAGKSDDGTTKAAATTVSDADVEAALQAGGNLTVWAWDPTVQKVAEQFQVKYPKVKVTLRNAGTGNDQYTALQNAIKAGTGVPDLAQIEYYALPQFSLSQGVTDLNQFGAGSLDGTFAPGTWNSVHAGEKIYGLPLDSGPMALFYNKEVFDRYGIEVPKTWDEYAAAAAKLHAANPKSYITSDTGDAGFTTSMIWQAGGRPYRVDGTTVGITFADAGTQKWTSLWQGLIDRKLLAPIPGWSDAWYKGLGDGTIATLVTGAWMPGNLETGVKAANGKWRVAPMPQWAAGDKVTAENGGSSLAITEASQAKTLAYGFLKFAAVQDGAQIRTDAGAFPATTAQLNADAFKNKQFPYFGGQKANEILSESAAEVATGWSYLPFQVYANTVYNDSVGKAYTGGAKLQDGLKAWQDASTRYGREQGFTIP
ncbi:sugar ABC transporter substrate-binding protein [Actinoplanes sp. SE50]|uniref:ABC transporter substrate-binding protein n=1 Tax=unclassified Actinoplanes TaxID=2626549 RepID=UPI00023EC83E|nr:MULTISPECIES: extracellular solute-binding protein [unclassified Actinoplanes]AEV86470.1 putative arabinose-binding protein [Actinoplanes sp. SE50/110]ATO84868.1 sugar ABC transporter substrate-binding protein [Actinoplanes sp. SE50]SLM02277.1 sugar ABC transporter substrate-binding protein [Actinoplanes sp. SE50/110]